MNRIWQTYQDQGYHAAVAVPASSATESFYQSLLAFGHQDFDQAAHYSSQAAMQEPDNLVYTQAAAYLNRVLKEGRQNVYATGDGFAAFIRGGSNPSLYDAAVAALHGVYLEYSAIRLLDIGPGNGRALLPALTGNIHELDLVEPSRAMLGELQTALAGHVIPHRAFCGTLQQFAGQSADNWDVIQATFSLQSISTAERLGLFTWLREHGARLLIAEFDVPEFAQMHAPDRVEYVVEHYRRGLAEYAGDGGLVAQGFLMPVMFGYFDGTAARTNYEQPIQAWAGQLKQAGFTTVETRFLYPYWWASAYLIDARTVPIF
ncbi:MAG TPA: class I SAM-dependent methyltransferase [Blastocatellia bacterium]|nr:class I SAM-dependent methyltransferase [Blastocatellia bacterium]